MSYLLMAGVPRVSLEQLRELLPDQPSFRCQHWRQAAVLLRQQRPQWLLLDERGCESLLDDLEALRPDLPEGLILALTPESFTRPLLAEQLTVRFGAKLILSTPLDVELLVRWLAHPLSLSAECPPYREMRVTEEARRPCLLTDRGPLPSRLLEQGLAVDVGPPHRGALAQLASQPPSVLIVDAGRDPETQAQLVREIAARHPLLPMLALSRAGGRPTRQELIQAGAAEVLDRSETPQRLAAEVRRLSHRAHALPRLLVAEPDPSTLQRLEVALAPLGAVLEALPSSSHFWEAAELVDPSLFVLSSELAPLPAGELCRALRTHPRFQDRPVLVLAHSEVTWHRLAEWGADDRLDVPLNAEEAAGKVGIRLARAAAYRQTADRDPLTALATRRRGRRDLERLLRLSRRYRQPSCLCILDLDRFKKLNDEHGHATGDLALCHTARWLTESTRAEDVVVRWGGEEFVVGFFGATAEQARTRLETLRDELGRDPLPEVGLCLSFSAGVAEYPLNGTEIDVLLADADKALYAAKAAGRARVFRAPLPERS